MRRWLRALDIMDSPLRSTIGERIRATFGGSGSKVDNKPGPRVAHWIPRFARERVARNGDVPEPIPRDSSSSPLDASGTKCFEPDSLMVEQKQMKFIEFINLDNPAPRERFRISGVRIDNIGLAASDDHDVAAIGMAQSPVVAPPIPRLEVPNPRFANVRIKPNDETLPECPFTARRELFRNRSGAWQAW